MTHGSLFSGIGGFDLAAEWMGWENIFHCENNPFGQKILKHYWPNAESINDVRQFDGTKYRGKIDVLTGGFPCQPFSTAGKRKGSEDDRYLWPEMLRIISEIKPSWIVGENVPGLLTIEDGVVFESVCAEMEAEGYEIQPVIIPACATGAPHRRDRIWFVAYSNSNGFGNINRLGEDRSKKAKDKSYENKWQWFGSEFRGENSIDTYTYNQGLEGCQKTRNFCSNRKKRNDQQFNGCDRKWNEHWFEAATRLCVVDDGLSGRLDGITVSKWRTENLKAAGNAIIPQVAYQIFQAIASCHDHPLTERN